MVYFKGNSEEYPREFTPVLDMHAMNLSWQEYVSTPKYIIRLYRAMLTARSMARK